MSLKNNALIFGIMVSLFLCFAGVTLTGCDNGDSYEAQLEDARIALDEGDYALAKSILASLPQTEEVLQYRSNAIAGGDLNLDTLNIISTLEDLDNSDDQGSIDMVGLIIGGGDDQLTADEISEKLASASEAIELFKTIGEMKSGSSKSIEDMAWLSDDQKMQVGLLGITRTVLTLADQISRALGGDPVTMTETWIQANRNSFLPVSPTQAEIDRIEEDILLVGYAIDVFSDTNDMKDDYLSFKSELDANDDGVMTADEINAYLTSM